MEQNFANAFLPTEVREVWESEEGPMKVEIILLGDRFALTPNRGHKEPHKHYGWIDLEVLNQINEILDKANYLKKEQVRFEVHSAFDQTGFVLALTPEEKSKLIRERRWKFTDLIEP